MFWDLDRCLGKFFSRSLKIFQGKTLMLESVLVSMIEGNEVIPYVGISS